MFASAERSLKLAFDTKFTWGPEADAIENVFEPSAVLPEQLIEIISECKPIISECKPREGNTKKER